MKRFIMIALLTAVGTQAQAARCLDSISLNPVATTICTTGIPTMLTGAFTGDLKEAQLIVNAKEESIDYLTYSVVGAHLNQLQAMLSEKTQGFVSLEDAARYSIVLSSQIEQ